MDKRFVIKPSKSEDIREFYGNKMRSSCWSWSVFCEDKLVGIGGVAITTNLMLVFMDMNIEDIDVSEVTVWRITLQIWKNIQSLGYETMYAVAEPKYPNAEKYLQRLGFVHHQSMTVGEVYRWVIQYQSD